MRSYNEVVRRVEAFSQGGAKTDVLGEVAGFPVFRVGLWQDDTLPTVFVNGGTHGDEPAGVEGALAFLEAGQARWLDRFRFEVIPCLNPYGYENNSRVNAQGIDINWAFLREDVPEIEIIKRFVEGKTFEAVVDLHEDWESPGYYLYEQFRGREPVGPEVTRRVARICPINRHPEIEKEVARGGVIFPNLEVEKRRKGAGIPVALFQKGYTDHLITSETPTGEEIGRRVKAHLVALETIIGAHAEG